MADPAIERVGGLHDNIAESFAAVTPSDTVSYVHSNGGTLIARGLYVGGAGNVALVNKDGVAVTFTAPPVGSILWFKHIRVNATNTTATLLVRLE